MAKEYTTKDGKKILGWYRRGGRAIPIVEGQAKKGEGKAKGEFGDTGVVGFSKKNRDDKMKKPVNIAKKQKNDSVKMANDQIDKRRKEKEALPKKESEKREEARLAKKAEKTPKEEKKKVRLPVGDYSGEPSRWSPSERYIEGDRIIRDKDGLIHVFNDGKKETLPKGYEIEDMHKDFDRSTFDTRVRKDGVYYYPKMPSRKKADVQARKEKEFRGLVEKNAKANMELRKQADWVREWGNVSQRAETFAKDDDERKKLQKASNKGEDMARLLEGRERIADISARLLKTASEHGEEVKKDLQDSLKGDAGSVDKGLPFMIKGQESMHRKLREKSAQKGLQPEEYADKVTDALRFTDMVDSDNYVESFNKLKKGLEDRGYEMVEVENTIHKEGAKYRGLNTLVESPKGYTFELQFHTPQSFDIKEENHKDYEVERRLTTSPDEKERLAKQMEERAKKIQTPKGAESIQNVPRHKRKGPSDSAIRNVMQEKGMSRTEAVLYLKKKNKY